MVIANPLRNYNTYEVKFSVRYDDPTKMEDVFASQGTLYVTAKNISKAIEISQERLKKSGWELIDIYSVFDLFYKKMEE